MANVGDSAHTDHGLGTITEVETLRGRTSFRVAGRGFNVWVPETRLRLANGMGHDAGLETTIEQGDTHDYPVTYPYDPSPQYPVDLFRKEQTILPGDYEIDPEDRLHPSDEDGKRTSPNRPYPGPNPDLFAKGASAHYAEDDDTFGDGDNFKEWGDDEWHEGLPDGPERTFGRDARRYYADGNSDAGSYRSARFHDDPMHPEYGVGSPALTHPPELEYDDPGNPNSVVTLKRQEGTQYHPGEGRHRAASYRPAGLDDRYAHILNDAEGRDPITAFRRDPLDFMQRHAYVMGAGDEERLHQKFADYDNLLAVDKQMRTAAWSDVRTKAQRLRHEGRVQVNHVTPQHIYATVEGDHGTYDTMIIKGASGAFSGGQSISNWSCDCDWGKWAFQRKYSYVGRLCSHAYAAYLDMQSHYQKGNQGTFKAASIVDDYKSWAKENNDGHMDHGSMTDFINTCEKRVTREEAEELYDHLLKNVQVAPERNYDVPYTFDNEEAYKTAADTDALRQRPLSLTPDLRVVPQGEGNQWTDVTEDDRETTGPDQIVHFGALAAKLHIADQAGLDAANGGGGPQAQPLAQLPNVPSGIGGPDSAWGHLTQGIGNFFNGLGGGDTAWGALHGQGQPQQAQPAGAVNPATPAGAGGPANGWDVFQQRAKDTGQLGADGKPTAAGGPAALPSATGPSGPGTAVGPDGKRYTVSPEQAAGLAAGGKNSIGEGAGAGANGQLGTGTGYGGAGFQGPNGTGPWSKSNETTGITGDSYQVKPGDTLNDIAQRSGLDVNELAKSNNIADPNKINSGQTLKLPGGGKGNGMPDPSTLPDSDDVKDGEAPVPGYRPPGLTGTPGVNDGGVAGHYTPSTATDLGKANDVQNPMKALQLPSSPQPPTVPKPPAAPQPPGAPKTSTLTDRLHYVAADNDDDDERPDTGEAAAKLDRLRDLSQEDPSDHYQHMDEFNDEIRDLVEELNEAGVDAMPFVANRLAAPQGQRKDSDPSDGDANFAGQSNPNWADESFNGSGPDPKLWSSDSASYVDEHERPDFTDVTDLPDGDIIKFNDSRSKPQQGPRHGSYASMLHQADLDGGATIGDFSNMNGFDAASSTDPMVNGSDSVGEGTVARRRQGMGEESGYFNPNNPSGDDWDQGSGDPFMDEVGHAVDQANPMHGFSGGGAEGEEGAGALAEEAPELLALASRRPAPAGGFSLEAFDRGEFSFDGAGEGELRRASRVGGGARQEVRVDPGGRGWERKAETYNPPEDFGNDGDPELASYSGDAGADPGMTADIVANFQRSAGALSMMHGGSNAPRAGSLDDFSSSPMVQSMMRTAGRKFTPEEERELEQESHVLGARNMPTPEELAGTHYLL